MRWFARLALALVLLATAATAQPLAPLAPGTYDPAVLFPPGTTITVPGSPPPPPPPPTQYALTLTVIGTGTTTGQGSYAAGTGVPLSVTPGNSLATVQWSGPAPCPTVTTLTTALVMPANALGCTVTITNPAPPAGSAGLWQRLGGGGGPLNWYFTCFSVERTATARIWGQWNGATYLFDPVTNTWAPQSTTNYPGVSGQWENYGCDHDPVANVYVMGPGAPVGNNQSPWVDQAITYDPATRTYATAPAGCGGEAALLYDAQRQRLLCFGGWSVNTPLRARVLPTGAWTDLNPSGPQPPLAYQSMGRDTLRRAAIKSDGTIYVVADGNALYRYDPVANAWALLATTNTPSYATLIVGLHQSSNTLVGWVGCDSIADPPGSGACPAAQNINRTFLLDLASGAWRDGPVGGTQPVCCIAAVRQQLLTDRVHDRVILVERDWNDNRTSVYAWTP